MSQKALDQINIFLKTVFLRSSHGFNLVFEGCYHLWAEGKSQNISIKLQLDKRNTEVEK